MINLQENSGKRLSPILPHQRLFRKFNHLELKEVTDKEIISRQK